MRWIALLREELRFSNSLAITSGWGNGYPVLESAIPKEGGSEINILLTFSPMPQHYQISCAFSRVILGYVLAGGHCFRKTEGCRCRAVLSECTGIPRRHPSNFITTSYAPSIASISTTKVTWETCIGLLIRIASLEVQNLTPARLQIWWFVRYLPPWAPLLSWRTIP